MNSTMVRRLILKDWYFSRRMITCYVTSGVISMLIAGAVLESAFFIGSILLITTLIALGVHMVMVLVIDERKENTLPFVMSLPISPIEYTTAKIAAVMGTFVVPWLAITVGCCIMVALRDHMPNGAIPYFVLVLGYLLVSFTGLLTVALVTESIGWTIACMAASNVAVNFVIAGLARIPQLAATLKGDTAVWSPLAIGILSSEVVVVAVLLGITFHFQARKKDFI